ncbi:MAG: hypothetical protein HQM06_03625 [Magnetococcales bacterium]|nr:hypothetical protein [Magnetococcales bacterium]
MTDYNLNGLSPRSFQQLVQALCIATLGNKVRPFGDGPDGGSDATFQGRVDYPDQGRPWDGDGVIQAKFRQRSDSDKEDQKWALQQLRNELKKYTEPGSKRTVPEYYLYVTNVPLSGVPEGGKKKALESLKNSGLNLKGYDVWDYDKLARLLDTQLAIRTAYAAWITPGDVLAELVRYLNELSKGLSANFEQVMDQYLQRELRHDQYANLTQAGHTEEKDTPLSKVFVDLAATPERSNEVPEKADSANGRLAPGIIHHLLTAGNERLKPSLHNLLLPGQNQEQGRFLLIGGPGQGKTTVGIFLAQIYRALILRDRRGLIQEVSRPLLELISQCESEGIALPKSRRFPVRIELKGFADALSNNEVSSLLEYFTNMISKKSEIPVTESDLHHWLQVYPWLLVLDGLDEVPASSNRREILEHITQFRQRVMTLDADIMIVATSRPQGYSGEFDKEIFTECWLSPLSTVRAEHYATRLVKARFKESQSRQDKVLGRLQRALQQDNTAKLMTSPLQVSIMAILLDHIGDPPRERWQLFNQYYFVMVAREIEKNTIFSDVLRDHRKIVRKLHQHVGLILHAANEHTRTTTTLLHERHLKKLLDHMLQLDGYEGDEISKLSKIIIDTAIDRMVLLVAPEDKRIGFEVRSIQEFMAAEGLMDAPESDKKSRLEYIAPLAHWLNVFLFAVGHVREKNNYLVDLFLSVCTNMNIDSNNWCAKHILPGSRLALEILEDIAATCPPGLFNPLFNLTLELLTLPTEPIHKRVSEIQHARAIDSLIDKCKYLLKNKPSDNLGTWFVVNLLIGKNESRAIELAEKYWPHDAYQQLDIIYSISKNERAINNWIVNKANEFVPNMKFTWNANRKIILIRELYNYYYKSNSNVLFQREGKYHDYFEIKISEKFPVTIAVNYLPDKNEDKQLKVNMNDLPNHPWTALLVNEQFAHNPSAAFLSAALRKIASAGWSDFQSMSLSVYCYWPLALCLSACKSSDELIGYADRVDKGEYGDIASWRKLQDKRVSSFVSLTECKFGDFEIISPRLSVHLKSGVDFVDCFGSIFSTIQDDTIGIQCKKLYAKMFLRLVTVCYEEFDSEFRLSANDFILYAKTIDIIYVEILSLINSNEVTVDKIKTINNVCLSHKIEIGNKLYGVEWLSDQFIQHPQFSGLLKVIAIGYLKGSHFNKIPLELLQNVPDDDWAVYGAVLLIKLVQGDFCEEEIEPSCQYFEQQKHENIATITSWLIKLFENNKIDSTAAAKFLSTWLSTFTSMDWEDRRSILRIMEKEMNAHNGAFTEEAVWNEVLKLDAVAYAVLMECVEAH